MQYLQCITCKCEEIPSISVSDIDLKIDKPESKV